MSTGRISNLYRVSLLCGDSAESRARGGGEVFEKNTGGLVYNGV